MPLLSLVPRVWAAVGSQQEWEGEAHLCTLNILPRLCLGIFVYLRSVWKAEVGP